MDNDNVWRDWYNICAAWLLTWAPAFGGSVVSLAFVAQLSTKGRVMTVLVGTLTAVFLAPALIDALALFWPNMPATFGRALKFLVSLSAMGALPPLLTWIKGVAGDPLGLVHKFRADKDPPQ